MGKASGAVFGAAGAAGAVGALVGGDVAGAVGAFVDVACGGVGVLFGNAAAGAGACAVVACDVAGVPLRLKKVVCCVGTKEEWGVETGAAVVGACAGVAAKAS